MILISCALDEVVELFVAQVVVEALHIAQAMMAKKQQKDTNPCAGEMKQHQCLMEPHVVMQQRKEQELVSIPELVMVGSGEVCHLKRKMTLS